ncbi:phage tail assembly protein [uncultured Desulfovibrio sp.]|uniref:phage tail assembly protein n=1 Tax=uncultured Desulfovibrio sp. TaxID=167968 RepID=UPI002639700C|nr:phage tail assembly protein [uncultured Desulfovibrio sp.]
MELPVKIPLSRPVTHGDEQIAELVIGREMVAGDLRGVSVTNMTFDDIYLVASRLANVPVSVINRLSMPDAVKLQGVITAFFEGGR